MGFRAVLLGRVHARLLLRRFIPRGSLAAASCSSVAADVLQLPVCGGCGARVGFQTDQRMLKASAPACLKGVAPAGQPATETKAKPVAFRQIDGCGCGGSAASPSASSARSESSSAGAII